MAEYQYLLIIVYICPLVGLLKLLLMFSRLLSKSTAQYRIGFKTHGLQLSLVGPVMSQCSKLKGFMEHFQSMLEDMVSLVCLIEIKL